MTKTTLTRDKSFMGLFHDDSREKVRVLQNLYDSEINFEIHAIWPSGFDLYIGAIDFQGQHWKTTGNTITFDEAIVWLAEKACELYPESEFAQYYAHDTEPEHKD